MRGSVFRSEKRLGVAQDFTRCWSAVLLILWVAGCGFQLRGQTELPAALERMHVVGLSEYDSLYVKLTRALRANGVQVVDAQDATAILRIINRTQGRRVLSVGADGRVQEFQLYTLLRFVIVGQGNPLKLNNQTLTTTRDFTFSQAQVLGKSSEADLLYEDMEDELVGLMLYRLQAAGHDQLS